MFSLIPTLPGNTQAAAHQPGLADSGASMGPVFANSEENAQGYFIPV